MTDASMNAVAENHHMGMHLSQFYSHMKHWINTKVASLGRRLSCGRPAIATSCPLRAKN